MTSKRNGNSADFEEQIDILNNKSIKPTKRLLTPLLFKRVPPIPEESARKPLPLYNKNILSRIFFAWLIPLFNVGYQRTLDNNDLWRLDDRLSIKTTYPKFQRNLESVTSRRFKKGGLSTKLSKYALLEALFYTFHWQLLFAFFAASVNYSCLVVVPVLMKKLIDVVEMKVVIPNSSIGAGVGYALGIVFLTALSGLANNHALQNSKLVGSHARTILTKALLEKSFVVSSDSKRSFPNGKVFSLMSSDLAKIDMAISYLPLALSIPLPFIAAIVLLIVNIGVAALCGIALFMISILLAAIPAKILMSYRSKSSSYTDERVGLMREILNAMKMIKFHAWEDAYESKVRDVRLKETRYILKSDWLTSTMFSIVFNLSQVSSMISFLVLYAIHSTKGSPGNIFASLSLFTTLTNLLSEFPMYLAYCTAGWVSITRVREFLEAPTEQIRKREMLKRSEDVAIKIVDGHFRWSSAENDKNPSFCLKNVNIEISKGEFIVITGFTGSGKSSLLRAIAGGLKTLNGKVGINGSLLYCGNPWIQSATIRENITFGLPFDSRWYYRTVRACALNTDLESLSGGDMTEVGERGVTLSGGQKARINLARAVYANKDIYLLDDVLSAVDSKVGKHIVDNCFTKLIAEKTTVIATHQLSLMNKADRIIFINEDGSLDVGTREEVAMKNSAFVSLLRHGANASSQLEDKNEQIEKDDTEMGILEEENGEIDKLYDVEEKAVNSIPLRIYQQYLNAGSGIFSSFALPIVIISTALTVFTMMFANVWLSFWIDRKFSGKKDGFYIGLYVMFIFLGLIFVTIELSIMGYITVNASKNLNLDALKQILHTPISFLDTTPSGRILNRFTKDTNSLDNEIGMQLKMLLHSIGMIIGSLVLCVIYLPWFAIAIPFIIMVFILITNYYQASSREVKRLEALSRSLVYNNFNEVLNGMETIKAYSSERAFVKKNDQLIDKLNESYLVTVANQRWIGISLDLTGCGLALIVTMLALTRQFQISAAATGLVVTYILDMSTLLSPCLISFSEVENEMNSVERLCHYANDLEQETGYKNFNSKPPMDWPEHGCIQFKNVSLRYREGLPLVLKNLNIATKSYEKIGICGRTGAGKSSLISALYRLTELADGTIEIDGVNVRDIGLQNLRSKLTIIPQDPVLFQGTIRKNLDPFGVHTDLQLWDALKRSGLVGPESIINQQQQESKPLLKFHLDNVVEDEGSNFSLGERQMIALTRAIVSNSKILIMDEATSNVDYDTDALIQETIAREFKDSTILCIAHRLKTILNYDRILVLEKGEVRQFDTPLKLYNEQGIFREMCDSSNITIDNFHL